MTTQLNVSAFGQVTVSSGDIPVKVDFQLAGGPVRFVLSLEDTAGKGYTMSLADVWGIAQTQLKPCVTLPNIPDGPWNGIFQNQISPEIYIGSSEEDGGTSAHLSLTYTEPAKVGFKNPYKLGPVEVTIEPSFTVNAVIIGYDSRSGLGIKASVTMPTQKTSPAEQRALLAQGLPLADNKGTVTKMVSYPFPLPAQGTDAGFKLHYIGLGQRVGPNPITDTSVTDPLAKMFDTIESNFTVNDPVAVITNLAKNFYHPDRGWFIAADLQYNAFRVRVLFNDPALYGLEITVGATPHNLLSGFRFEILYQKLSDNLGVYFAAIDLPTQFRRIPLEAFILILPGFSIWIYTNGDFRLNVGWPVSDNSIGISWEILTGWVGFYIAKLRSSDNPGAQPNDDYDPILAIGIGFRLSAGVGFNSGPLSASLSVSATVTMQGLVAWKATNANIAGPPDAYWFAGTFELQVLVSGAVDFKVIKISVTISLGFQATIALENGYGTELNVSAHVEAKASIKILFVRIHFSFGTTVRHSFTLASGPNGMAVPSGPLAPGLRGLVGPSEMDLAQRYVPEVLAARDAIAPVMRAHDDLLAPPPRLSPSLRQDGKVRNRVSDFAPTTSVARQLDATSAGTTIDLYFVLQSTVIYPDSRQGDSQAAVIGMLMTEAPAPKSAPTADQQTSFEKLVSNMVCWLLNDYAPSSGHDTLAERLATLEKILGPDSTIFNTTNAFGAAVKDFFAKNLTFTISGVSDQDMPADLTGGSVLPMFDLLVMDVAGDKHDFSSFNPLPDNYGQAVDLYFDGLGLFATSDSDDGVFEELMAVKEDDPSMASFVFSDAYQALMRKVVDDLYQEAIKQQNMQVADLIRGTDLSTAPSLAASARFLRETDHQVVLDSLLEDYDYGAASGFMSRTLLNGLQLPVPTKVPNPVTAQNVHKIPVDGLYALSGQLFTVTLAASGNRANAVLTLTDSSTSWITLDTYGGTGASDAESANASIGLPDAVPTAPQPTWSGLSAAVSGTLGTIAYSALDSVASVDMAFTVRQQQVVTPPASAQEALIAVPGPLMTLAAQQAGLQLALHDGGTQSQAATLSVTEGAYTGVAALVFEIPITQVTSATQSDDTGAATVGIIPNLYQVGATDDASRDQLEALLKAEPGSIEIDILYSDDKGKGLAFDTLDPAVLIARSNLSTQNQVKSTGFRLEALFATLADTSDIDFAALAGSPLGFLRLLWEVSVVNASGFFLYYRTKNGQDLPSSLFQDSAPSSDGDGSAKVPGSSGGVGNLQILVRLAADAASLVPLPAYANCVLTSDLVGKTASLAVSDAGGTPLLSWHSAYGPGDLGFRLDWTEPPASDPVTGEIDVDALYSLMQFSVDAPGSPMPSNIWSLPLTPVQPDGTGTSSAQAVGTTLEAARLHADSQAIQAAEDPTEQIFQQVFPAYQFLGRGGGINSVYGLVGKSVSTAFRLLDIFGNALPGAGRASQTGAYHDPIQNVGQWAYVAADQAFQSVSGAPTLNVWLSFDGSTIQGMLNGSITSGSKAQVQSVLNSYLLIQEQLTDANMSVQLTSSLLAGQANVASPKPTLVTFVGNIISVIQHLLGGTAPASLTVSTSVSVTVDGSTITALAENIIPVTVGMVFSRPADKVASGVAEKIPTVATSTAVFKPRALKPPKSGGAGGAGSDDSNVNIGPYAKAFETAFANYDGKGSSLKFAVRAGVSADQSNSTVATLFAVRFAGKSAGASGISVAFSGDLRYLALEPLNTAPVTREVDNVTYSDVDMDIWSRDCFGFIDALFEPRMAVALSLLDERNGTTNFTTLSNAKQSIARNVPKHLVSIFDGQTAGDAASAAADLEAAMLDRLSAAYTVSTVVQAAAAISVAPSQSLGGDSRPPELVGRFGPPLAEGTGGTGSNPTYSLSNARLDLGGGQQWTNSLLSLTDPAMQKELDLQLEFAPGFVQFDFETDATYDGYTPSSWLKFVFPEDATLSFPITTSDPAQIPIPLPYEPTAPVLITAKGSGTPITDPSSDFSKLIEQLLEWTYKVTLSSSLSAQDTLFYDAIFGSGTVNAGPRSEGGTQDYDTDIFDAMARLKVAWAAFEPDLPALLDAAYSGQSSVAFDQALANLVTAVSGLASAWEPDEILKTCTLDDETPEIIHYAWSIEVNQSNEFVVQLRGYIDGTGSRRKPTKWPIVSYDPNDPSGVGLPDWTPDPKSATKQAFGDGDWWVITNTYPASAFPGGVIKFPKGYAYSWPSLNMLQQQLGRFESWVVRNAELVVGKQTNPVFIGTTNVVSFANPTIPQIVVTNLKPVTPDKDLQTLLRELLTPLALKQAELAPYIRLEAVLHYVVASGQAAGSACAITATAPYGLVPNITLSAQQGDGAGTGTPADQVANAFTTVIQQAHNSFNGSTDGLVLDIAVTLFGTKDGQQLPLVTVDPLPIDVSAQPSSWWAPSSGG